MTASFRDREQPTTRGDNPSPTPDHAIDGEGEHLERIPANTERVRHKASGGRELSQDKTPLRYDASLSTMWGIGSHPGLHEFFVAARQLGFSDVELNHQISPAMLVGIDLKGYRFSSIHEPCPTDISTETLKRRDWLISSFDDDCRRQGVAAVKRSIDLANELGAKTVVMHAGNVVADGSLENDLRALFKSGQSQTPKYSETTNSLIELRAKSSGRHLEAVKRSLIELLEYAGHCAVRLGLENRYHYLDIPTQDEMALLLDMAGPDQLGFVYDVGHAQAMDRLGFYPHEMWLKRYARRIFGVHLHDVIGIDDHHAPGVGDVDFCMVATYLPEDAFRTYELDARNSTERVKTGLKFLVKHGCIKRL